jgi:hypothetical protein
VTLAGESEEIAVLEFFAGLTFRAGTPQPQGNSWPPPCCAVANFLFLAKESSFIIYQMKFFTDYQKAN